ncbi:hypothetical protein AOZ84_20355 [Salmonella enterica subsp. enterica serovar Newport]|nr:hypothetical protein [Salmonella enterica subsp. enterica serovar Newport]
MRTKRGNKTEGQYQAECLKKGVGSLARTVGSIAAFLLVFNVIGFQLMTHDLGFDLGFSQLLGNGSPLPKWLRISVLTLYGFGNVLAACVAVLVAFALVNAAYRGLLSAGGYRPKKVAK